MASFFARRKGLAAGGKVKDLAGGVGKDCARRFFKQLRAMEASMRARFATGSASPRIAGRGDARRVTKGRLPFAETPVDGLIAEYIFLGLTGGLGGGLGGGLAGAKTGLP